MRFDSGDVVVRSGRVMDYVVEVVIRFRYLWLWLWLWV